MRVVGVDIGAETHVVAVVDEDGRTLLKPTSVTEDAEGYGRILELIGEAADTLVVMEATGHYCRTSSRRWRPGAWPSPW